jgi:glycerate kinase
MQIFAGISSTNIFTDADFKLITMTVGGEGTSQVIIDAQKVFN